MILEEDQVLKGDLILDIDTIFEEDLDDYLNLMAVDTIKQMFFDIAWLPNFHLPIYVIE
jgi:hypothetical protein